MICDCFLLKSIILFLLDENFLCFISNPKTGVNDEIIQVMELKVVSVQCSLKHSSLSYLVCMCGTEPSE